MSNFFNIDYEAINGWDPDYPSIKECMTDILRCVSPVHRDLVKTEVERLGKEFAELTPEQRADIYNRDGLISWIWDHDRLGFKTSEVFLYTPVVSKYDRPEYELEEAILDYLFAVVREEDEEYEEAQHGSTTEASNYSIEDDRFIIEYCLGGIYSVVDKLTKEEFILDNVDASYSLKDVLQLVYAQLKDEE